MEILGYPVETIYLYSLFICGGMTLLYVLLGDILEGIFEVLDSASSDFLNPTLILSFFTIFSANGYIFEKLTNMQSWLIVVISVLISLVLVTLLNVFVLIPLSSAEESVGYSNEDLKGRVGEVIVGIPKEGYGEVLIKGNLGTISKSAKGFEGEEISSGNKVLVIEVKDNTLYVVKHNDIDY